MLIGMQVTAAENIYVREYSYKASELDSKVSARKNALDQVKALLLEEIATYVYTSSSSTQSLGADYQKQFVQNVKNISAGFLGAKVLDENWDGNIFWLRAEIHADPGKILDELKTALNTVPATSTYDVADTSTVMPVHRNYVQKANLASAINLIMPIKIQMLEYYQMMGDWPTTFEQLGLKQADMRDGDLLDSVKIGKAGEMTVRLGQKFGDKKYFTLKPEVIMGGMNIKWVCKTNMPKTEVPMGMNCDITP